MTTLTEKSCKNTETFGVAAQLGLHQSLLQWFKTLRLKAVIQNERRQLLEMPDAMLRDLGITRAEAEAEARRKDIPVFRVNSQGRLCC